MLCTQNKCPHWGNATKYKRKCYYEPLNCWRGQLDLFILIIKERFTK